MHTILYRNYIHNVYDVHFLYIRIDVYEMYTKCFCIELYPTFRQNFVYILYTKCFYAKCIPHLDKLLYIKCIQNDCIQN